MAAHNDFGRAVEDLACDLVSARGWQVLHRNWRFRRWELDIVARRGSVIAFIEVRARRSAAWGHPLRTIDWRKRRGLEAAAAAWIGAHGRRGDQYRFDAVTLVGTAAGGVQRLEYLEDAWRT